MPDKTAEQIVQSLPRERKLSLVSGLDFWHTHAVPEHDVPSVMVTDGPHGLRKQAGSGDHVGISRSVPATCFPTAAGLAATWDEALAAEVGEALGRECRAENVAVLLGPGLNLKRHPCGGRNFEYFSEDPLISGKIAAALVRGVQSQGVGTSLKHFAANNQETNRMTIDTIVDPRTLHELYLTGFEIAVRESAPWTVMCAYNQLHGEFCSESRWLLTELLREEWGFEGLVMTDWGATNERAPGIAAGLDLDMPGNQGAHDARVDSAIASGALAEADLDLAARRVVELALRSKQNVETQDHYDADAHHALARRAAAASAVLLRNDGTLPLAGAGHIAVIGAFAEHSRYQGAGSSQVTPTRVDTALAAIRARAGDAEVHYAPGYDVASGDTSESLLTEAVAAATGADVVLLFAGLPERYESEGFDREHMRLPEGHDRLIEAVCAANPRTAVVLCAGAPVEMPWVASPAAILLAYLGGQAGGSGITDVLFGDAEPGGRLAETFPLHLEDVVSSANFATDPRQVEYREGLYVGYRYFDSAGVPVLFPFGHGLSYTQFEYSDLAVSGAGQAFELTATVTNRGDRSGSEVVQLYVRAPESSVYRPDKELRAFAKLHLAAGESRAVKIPLGPRAFAHYDAASSRWQVEGGGFEILVGSSAAVLHGALRAEVTSEFTATPGPGPAAFVASDAEFESMLGHAIPQPAPALPFHRNSTVNDLAATALGRLVQKTLLKLAGRQFSAMGAQDAPNAETLVRMFEAVIRESPLRSLVALTGGRVSHAALDGLLDALNGHWGRVLERAVGRR